jgi:hypothetical protein
MFVHPTPLRNLHKDFMDLNEEMQVYVRIKPSKDDTSILSISGNHIIVQPSKDSISFKNRSNAGTKTLQSRAKQCNYFFYRVICVQTGGSPFPCSQNGKLLAVIYNIACILKNYLDITEENYFLSLIIFFRD